MQNQNFQYCWGFNMKHFGIITGTKRGSPFGSISLETPSDYADKIRCHISDYEENVFDNGVNVEFEIQPNERHEGKYVAVNVRRSSKNVIHVFSEKQIIGHNFGKGTDKKTQATNYQEMINRLKLHIENGELCMVMWRNPTPTGVVDMNQVKEESANWGKNFKLTTSEDCTNYLLRKCKDIFPDYCVEKFDGREINFGGKSHTLIGKMWKAVLVISKSGQNIETIVDCRDKILEQSYPKIIKKSEKRWTVIGDETGSFLEFKGTNHSEKINSTHYWMVVPPGVELPPLSPFFHGTSDKNSLLEPLIWLYRNPEIVLFSFVYEEGKKVEGAGKIADDVHYSMWLETLPLVLEYVSNNVYKKAGDIEIYSEQVGSLEAGKNLFESKILSLKTALRSRKGWARMEFVEKMILAKNPCEHPWMGYPDALAHVFDNQKMEEIGLQEEIVEDLRSRIISSPFRQSSLNRVINQSLEDSGRPLFFLKSLSDISKEDIRDYVNVFFGGAIVEARDSLSNREWQSLLEHFKNTAETIEGQHAANLIVANIEVDAIVSRFPKEMDKYILLKSILGSSNHVGTTKIANKCKVYIDDLLHNGLELSKREHKKLKTLQAGANDNQFDWAHIIDFDDFDDFDEEDVIDWNEEIQHYFGSQALSRALRNESRDLDEAMKIENKLRSIHQKDWEYRRRYVYYSELLMMKSEYEEAKRVLEFEFPSKIGEDDNTSHLADRYYLATLLKACALTGSTDFYNDYSKLILKSLDEKHPSQRIAYWYSRWVHQLLQSEEQAFIDKMDLSVLESCTNHLLSLTNYDFFKKEAPGVILACELIDLYKRGLVEEEHESFLKDVLANSEVFANEWVGKNPPNEEDWLAPLNFNYR